MKVGIISPVAWRTPPRHYGPWERVVSLLVEGLVKKGLDVTLFATGDSVTSANLKYICKTPYEEDKELDAKVCECLHISYVMEQAGDFDILHNNFDFLPLTYSRLINTPVVTTIHGFSSEKIIPVYEKYNRNNYYVSISYADRSPKLSYTATVYHGIDIESFDFKSNPEDYLLYFGRIHHDKGTVEAIETAQRAGKKLVIAGIIQDELYFEKEVKPYIDGENIIYAGSVGPVERNKLLGSAYCLIHPINFEEPFGLSIVEAMACGTPVIAFSKGSMPEIIQEGINGYLVDDVDQMVRKINEVKYISRVLCRKTVEDRFSQERMVDDYIEVYRKILN
ncbi:MAG: glycosyltransferase family 4 protein [Deltaproteobacteria bacterium]